LSADGARSVLIQDLSLTGAKVLGKGLPSPGVGVMLKVGERFLLGEVAWAADDYRGISFDFAQR
jgi:hypothetical protein